MSVNTFNLMLLLATNVLFLLSGMFLNFLVILSFWRSAQLRRKLCYFMILILSYCDLLAALTNNPIMVLMAMTYLTERFYVHPRLAYIISMSASTFLGLPLLALFVLNFERYLATYYPIFHRTSVTKGRLLILLGILIVANLTLRALAVNDFAIPNQVSILIFFVTLVPPVIFIIYKLFTIAKKNRGKYRAKLRTNFALKNVSSCLLATTCFVVLSIPAFVYLGISLSLSWKQTMTLYSAAMAASWSKTLISVNSTFNSLIFYWRDKALRSEGMKVIKAMKTCRQVQPQSDSFA